MQVTEYPNCPCCSDDSCAGWYCCQETGQVIYFATCTERNAYQCGGSSSSSSSSSGSASSSSSSSPECDIDVNGYATWTCDDAAHWILNGNNCMPGFVPNPPADPCSPFGSDLTCCQPEVP